MPNEATNFMEAVAENFRDVFLGQGHGEETVSYLPDGGTLRELTVRVIEAKTVYRNETHHRVKETILRLSVEQHATRGIDSPREGDILFRGVEPDLGDAYDYSEIESDDRIANAFILRFIRQAIDQAGPNMQSPL